MIINKETNVVTDSNWDSGRHLSFQSGVMKDEFRYKTLDEVLSKEEILVIESVINTMVAGFIKDHRRDIEK